MGMGMGVVGGWGKRSFSSLPAIHFLLPSIIWDGAGDSVHE